jgi:hypothetical protein
MTYYEFRYCGLRFSVIAENDKEAVRKARQAIIETTRVHNTIAIEFTGGASNGHIVVPPGRITTRNIQYRWPLGEEGVPF